MQKKLNDSDFFPKKTGFEIPKNYFESLETKITSKIKSEQSIPSVKNILKPYLLIAASFAAIFIIWQAILFNSPSKFTQKFDISYIDLQINDMDDETIIMAFDDDQNEEISDNDIINYLTQSNVNDLIEY